MPDALRQQINRLRSKNSDSGPNPKTLAEIDLNNDLKLTNKGENFLVYDTGSLDEERLLIFGTDENLRLLCLHKDWFLDGTFDITPLLIKQVYTIHIIKCNKVYPMVYCLLPNKKKLTYIKLFKIILEKVGKRPNSVNVDFEKAVFSAAEKVFRGCEIYGCFFHFSQSLFRRIQLKGLFTRDIYNCYI